MRGCVPFIGKAFHSWLTAGLTAEKGAYTVAKCNKRNVPHNNVTVIHICMYLFMIFMLSQGLLYL
jgi:hypothetical protein